MPDPYISEVKYLGGPQLDFVEVAVDTDTDVSNIVVTIYNSNGIVRSNNSLSNLTPTTIAGRDVYVVESGSPSTFSGLHQFGGVALSESGTVYQFVSFSDNEATITATAGAANGLTSTDIGEAGSGRSLETTDGGATYSTQTSPSKGTVPCLTRGTSVQTDKGLVKVEDIKPGMRLETVEGTCAPLRLVLRTFVSRKEFLQNVNLAPIRISAGSLGLGLPTSDLLVSRQHRMLVSSTIAKRMFNETCVLVAAIRLTKLPGIFVDVSVPDVEYFHLLLDQHCVIFAENAPTESLFVGEHIKSSLSDEAIKEIYQLFPQLAFEGHQVEPACMIPNRKHQKRLIERHAKNAKELLSTFRPIL
jgi:hypothetical protein